MKSTIILILFGLFLAGCNDSGDESSNSLTDVNKSYQTGQVISYIPYDDGYYRAGVIRNYIKSNNSVKELIKGMEWEDDTAILENSFTNEEALMYCYNLDLNGYNDWRLPTLEEFYELIDYGTADPALSSNFTNTTTGYFWTQTPCPVCEAKSFAISEANGVFYSFENTNSFHTMCVRGYKSPIKSYERDDSLNVVIDQNKKLMWQDGNSEEMKQEDNFADAVNYCESLEYAGFDDWRLPNIIELRSTLDFSGIGNDGLLNVAFQERLINSWSATTDSKDSTQAWNVEYYLGTSSEVGKEKFTQKRCVRSIDE